MKVLIIADNLSDNAPGVVFRNLLEGLSAKIEYDLITSTPNYSLKHDGETLIIPQTRIKSWRIRTYLFELQGYYYTQKKWATKVTRLILQSQYDVVISLMSSTFYSSVMAAELYSRTHKTKHICYCVDAVPAPFPWENEGRYSNAMKRFVRKYLNRVDVLCMTNQEMLNYEIDLIGNHQIKSVVVPNPPIFCDLQPLDKSAIEPSFAFAGQIYGVRNPDALIQGFEMFQNKHPDAKLYFIGTKNIKEELIAKGSPVMSNIVFLPYTRDLASIYTKCCALIDVNANIDNDVFLSSKIVSYLPFDRMIISESGQGSPARSIFKNSKSIIHVSHSAEQYLSAMLFCYENLSNHDFSERKAYLQAMNMDAATNKIISNFVC